MNKTFIKTFSIFFAAMLFCPVAEAVPLSVFDSSNGWTEFASEDWVGGYVDVPVGGQWFDTEYLFYNLEGSNLSIGLQTGFDVLDGTQYNFDNNGNRRNYFAGDIGLSFDGDPSFYEYALDFGLPSADYAGNPIGSSIEVREIHGDGVMVTVGVDAPGLYQATTWNSVMLYPQVGPFAMDSGTLIGGLTGNERGYEFYGSGQYDYTCYRIVTFDLFDIPGIMPGEEFTVDAHWTMSCGNDAINGSFTETAPVPEPATFLLLGSGLLGLALQRKKRA